MSLELVTSEAQADRMEKALQMRASQQLVAAYQVAKGLTELLSSIDKPGSPMFLRADEKQAISIAHADAQRAFSSLNRIVIDRGQDEAKID